SGPAILRYAVMSTRIASTFVPRSDGASIETLAFLFGISAGREIFTVERAKLPSPWAVTEPVNDPVNSTVLTPVSDSAVLARISFGSVSAGAAGAFEHAPRTTVTTARSANSEAATERRNTESPCVTVVGTSVARPFHACQTAEGPDRMGGMALPE